MHLSKNVKTIISYIKDNTKKFWLQLKNLILKIENCYNIVYYIIKMKYIQYIWVRIKKNMFLCKKSFQQAQALLKKKINNVVYFVYTIFYLYGLNKYSKFFAYLLKYGILGIYIYLIVFKNTIDARSVDILDTTNNKIDINIVENSLNASELTETLNDSIKEAELKEKEKLERISNFDLFSDFNELHWLEKTIMIGFGISFVVTLGWIIGDAFIEYASETNGIDLHYSIAEDEEELFHGNETMKQLAHTWKRASLPINDTTNKEIGIEISTQDGKQEHLPIERTVSDSKQEKVIVENTNNTSNSNVPEILRDTQVPFREIGLFRYGIGTMQRSRLIERIIEKSAELFPNMPDRVVRIFAKTILECFSGFLWKKKLVLDDTNYMQVFNKLFTDNRYRSLCEYVRELGKKK